MALIANVEITDTFDAWRIKTNQLIEQSNQSFEISIASFNYSNNALNNVEYIAANTTANILASNAYVINTVTSAVVASVNANVAVIFTSNTFIMNSINTNANLTATKIITSPSYNSYVISTLAPYVVDSVNANAANIITQNTLILQTIYDNANLVTTNITTSPSFNTYVTTSLVPYVEANVYYNSYDIIFSNTDLVVSILDNANTIAESFLSNTSLGYIAEQSNTARLHANASFLQANTARDHANAAYEQANTVSSDADEKANAAIVTANIAFDTANGAFDTANGAFAQANLAFDQANTSLSNTNTDFFYTGNFIMGDLTIFANGMISMIAPGEVEE